MHDQIEEFLSVSKHLTEENDEAVKLKLVCFFLRQSFFTIISFRLQRGTNSLNIFILFIFAKRTI